MRRTVRNLVVVGVGLLLNLAASAPVAAARLFTDDPLVASASVRAVHITELRALINALRVQAGMTAFSFADTNLTGVMVKAQHLTEMRTALDQAFDFIGQPRPTYTDATITAHQTFIKGVHIKEIRAAILALDTHVLGTIDLGTYPTGEVWAQLNGAFTWAVQGGSTLPPGTSLRTDTPSWFQPDAHAGVIGVATAAGTYEFTMLRTGVPQNYRLRVIPMMLKDYFQAPDAFVNKPFSFQLTATNPTGAVTWTPNIATLPPGMSLSATGLLSGTPTAAGTYQVNFSATDNAGQVFGGIQMNIYAVQITTSGALPNATQGVPYSATVAASGGSGGYTFTANNLPFGLTLDPATGTISGTTTAGPTHWWFNVTATDSSHASYSKTMSIDILSVPMKLPTVSPRGSNVATNFFDDCSLGVPCALEASVTNGGRAPFAWSATGLPPGMSTRSGSGNTTSWIAPENVEVWGAPAATGTFPVQMTVQDADGRTATNTFPLRVSPLALTEYPGNLTVGTPLSHYFRVVGGRLPYSAAVVARRLPLGLALDPTALTLSGTPVEDGNFAPVIEFTDADGMKLRLTIYMFVASGASTMFVNASEDFGTIAAGFFYSNQLNACCAPSGSTWSIDSGSLPPGLSLAPGGLLSGTPTTPGTFTFVVKAKDSTNASNFALRQITITVTPITVVSINLPVGHVGSPYAGSIVVAGFTGNVVGALEPFQYMPPGLTFHNDGTVDGTPTAAGQYSFAARATDDAGHILIRTFTINVYPAGVNPPVNLTFGPTFTLAIGGFTSQIQAFDGTPAYSYSVAPAATLVPGMRVQSGPPLPTNFTISPNGTGGFLGVLTGAGSFQTVIRAIDSIGGFIDRSVTVNVTPLRILSQTQLPKATVGVPYSYTLTPFGGASYSWAPSNLPPGLSLNSTTGTISGTPTSAGTFFPNITLTATGVSGFNGVTFTLVVDPFAIVAGTAGVLPDGTAGVAYSQALTTNPAGCGSTCTWSVVGGQPPAGVSLTSAGVLQGTPTGTFNGSFFVQATGSAGTVQKLVSLRIVSSSPQTLTINSQIIGDTTVGGGPAISLLASGGVPPYTWSIVSGALPPGASLQGPGETIGSNTAPGFTYITGRPMQPGLYSFTLDVADGAGSPTHVQKAFTWRISELASLYNQLPIAGNPLVVNTPYTQPLLFTGGSGRYTFTAMNPLPPGLTLNSSTGVVSGTPTAAGSYILTVQAVDTNSKSLTQSIFITVSP